MVPKDPSLQQPETGREVWSAAPAACRAFTRRRKHAASTRPRSHRAGAAGSGRSSRPRRLPQQACEGLRVSLASAPPGDTLAHSQEERGSGGGDEASSAVRK